MFSAHRLIMFFFIFVRSFMKISQNGFRDIERTRLSYLNFQSIILSKVLLVLQSSFSANRLMKLLICIKFQENILKGEFQNY